MADGDQSSSEVATSFTEVATSTTEVATSSTETPTFYPPQLWGLDFHFNTFNKLYITDILAMKPYPAYPGAFVYGNHPVYKVDIMGLVVRMDDKPKLYLYSVDDGTGVINCCCWKRPLISHDEPQGSEHSARELSPDLQSELLALRAGRERDATAYQLGDLVHVRGKLKMFRDLVEIVAYYHCRVDNPNHQVSRMLELPHLYGHCYDKPFVPPYKIEKELLRVSKGAGLSSQKFQSVKEELKEKVQQELRSLREAEFSLHDLTHTASIADLALHLDDRKVGGEEVVRGVLREMEEVDGVVCCRRHHASSTSFENLSRASPLERHVMSVLRSLSSRPKNRDRGCHYQQILGEVQRSVQYSSLHSSALLHVLRRLETNSDVITVTPRCYLPL